MRDYAFGERLSALRRECGYSQFQLASLIGVSDKAVSKWETGASKPRMKTCQKLASALGVDLDGLFGQIGLNSSEEGEKKKMKKLWTAAEERLYSLYGNEADLCLIDRFKAEKDILQDTEAIVLFAALTKVRSIAEKHHTLITVRGFLNGSFSAWLMGATVFNPLPAHYHCPVCKRISFHPEVQDGFDLPKKKCECGRWLNRDGHNLPFETYKDKAKRDFSSVDCLVSTSIVSEAWRELLAFFQDEYICDRYVFRQTEETGFPGQFSRLYFYPGENKAVYQSIDDVPEISQTMMLKNRRGFPSILLLDQEDSNQRIIPSLDELLSPDILQQAIRKNSAPQYWLNEITSFHQLVQAEAASHATMKKGFDLIQFAADHGLENYTELPLTREEIWTTIIRASQGNRGITSDILHHIKMGKYVDHMSPRDADMMKRIGLPEWFPEYAASVLYLFPKSHCIDFAYRNLVEVWNERV